MARHHLRLANALPDLSYGDVNRLLYRLSPQQRWLLCHVSEQGETNSTSIHTKRAISNISSVVKIVNKKLAAVGSSRRIVCDRRPYTNEEGDSYVIGYWRITDGGNV